MTTDELIARAKASLDGVTPGPWFAEMDDETVVDNDGDPLVLAEAAQEGDLFFIAASRQLVPDLIAALRAEREARERAEAMVAAAYQDAAETASRKAKFTKEAMQKATAAQIMANLVQFTESRTAYEIAAAILTRTPADEQASLDRMLQQAADEALERANMQMMAMVEKADALLTTATELAQYASYAEIVGGVSVNGAPIRKWCDAVFVLRKTLPEGENFEPSFAALKGGA